QEKVRGQRFGFCLDGVKRVGPLQRLDSGLELGGDIGGRGVGWEGNGGADVDGEFAEVGEAAMLLFHLPDAIEAYGDDGLAEILGEEADAGLEGSHVRGVAVVDDAFGENEEAIATIGGFAGEAETLAETGKLRQRENIEERDNEEIAELPKPALGEKPFARRVTKLA